MQEGRAPVALALLGLVVAGVAGLVLGSPPGSVRGPAAAANLARAWHRQLEGTWAVDATFTRTLDDGARFQAPVRTVQRPPDHLEIGLGNVSGRLGGDVVRCAGLPTGGTPCTRAPGAPPYADDVATQMDALRTEIDGDRPVYAVVDFGGGCFRLDLARQLPAPPYGDHALFCFDGATGAPLLRVIERANGVERTASDKVRATVTDADVQLGGDVGDLAGAAGPPTTPTTTTATTTTTEATATASSEPATTTTTGVGSG